MIDRFATLKMTISSNGTTDPLSEDAALVSALCRGDEASFALLVDQHHAAMVRVASLFVGGQAAAEDVVQDVWLIVIRGIAAFQGRSSLKTWIFRILTNRAKTAGQRERCNLPLPGSPGVDWPESETASMPEDSVLMQDAIGIVLAAIEDLPQNQREVITLRDVEGRAPTEVCRLLELSEGNQRVLLHRARARVRERMHDYHEQVKSDHVG